MGVPDTVMGLTFVAAGVSVPDALSSLAVLKEGRDLIEAKISNILNPTCLEQHVLCLNNYLFNRIWRYGCL